MRVERCGHGRLGVVVGQSLDDHTHLLLLDQLVDVAEALGVVGGQRLFEEQATGGGLEACRPDGRRSSGGAA